MNDMNTKPGSFGALPLELREPDIAGNIYTTCRNLISLEGCPKAVLGRFTVSDNPSLFSLFGGPEEVLGASYMASHCGLTSLDGIPIKIGGSLYLNDNPLTSLQGINKLKEMNGSICINGCLITNHILGVFFIKGCQGISVKYQGDFGKAADIVNRHIDKGRAGLLPCQKELIEAGLADFAQI
jgi:hypothetical protein